MAQPSAAAAYHRNFYGTGRPSLPSSKTDLDVLIERHRFIRESEEQNLSWEDALAKKAYDQLFKELAVCDLSRWREGKVAMRWRTSSEVINGNGHLSCSNLRCKYHDPRLKPASSMKSNKRRRKNQSGFEEHNSFIPLEDAEGESEAEVDSSNVKLQELQTKFGYTEEGQSKIAEVKLKLCKRCSKKMEACSKSKRRVDDGSFAPSTSNANTVRQSTTTAVDNSSAAGKKEQMPGDNHKTFDNRGRQNLRTA